MRRGERFVGTSGWAYDWEAFYPDELAKKKRLSYYSRQFSTVEVNYSFYRLPQKATFERWAEETPKDFTFTLKLSRFITHVKRLKGVKTALRKFFSRAEALQEKMGAVLVQLPPNFHADTDRLTSFLEDAVEVAGDASFPKPPRFAFEFRHGSWFSNEETAAALKRAGAAMVFAHSRKYPYPEGEPVTADFAYLRLHGPEKLFASAYRKAGLAPWAEKIRVWQRSGKDVYVYFNNDVHGYAHQDARSLLELLHE